MGRTASAANRHRAQARAPGQLLAFGLLALAAGALVYATSRDPARVALMPAALRLDAWPWRVGAWAGWLPSFCHPLAFSLFSAALLPRGARSAFAACAGWWVLNLAFEFAQHPALSHRIAEALSGLGPAGGSGALAGYLVNGTFDPADLAAATAGALVAAVLVRRTAPVES